MPRMCYTAALPLAIYGLLLALDVITRSDASQAILLFCEAAAVVVTIRALRERYRPTRRT